MNFDMSIKDNYASFIDKETGIALFVDSFDNDEFEVRIGSVTESKPAGSFHAKTDFELNNKLAEIFEKFRGGS